MESKSVDTRSIYRELGATLSYNMRLGNGMEVEPWLKAAVRKEFVDDNRVKVNNDGNFVNDLSGRRGIYQAGIKASFRSLYIDLCNCLILICSIQHQMKVKLWTTNNCRLRLRSAKHRNRR